MRLNQATATIGLLPTAVLALYVQTAVSLPIAGRGTWETTLLGRDLDGDPLTFEAWYDAELGITWLGDAYLIYTTGYDTDHTITWDDSVAWINYLNASNYLGHSNWRLPTLSPVNGSEFLYDTTYDGSTDRAYNVSAPGSVYSGSKSSELAYLFYNTLGNLSYYDLSGNPNQPGNGLVNTGPFQNIQPTGYWTNVIYALVANGAWQVNMNSGFQDPDPTFATIYKPWPVHDGDIGQPANGDINMDGDVDAGDVLLAVNHVLGVSTLDYLRKSHGDVYPKRGDGVLDTSDVVVLIGLAVD